MNEERPAGLTRKEKLLLGWKVETVPRSFLYPTPSDVIFGVTLNGNNVEMFIARLFILSYVPHVPITDASR